MKIILINGPPSSGKDTAALEIEMLLKTEQSVGSHFIFNFERMSRPVKEAFAGMIGPDLCGIDSKFNVSPFEATKEEVIPTLGCSYRQWQIDFSEKFMKPLYGENIFTRLFINRAQALDLEYYSTSNREPVLVVPDCGFQIEFETILTAFDPSDVALIRLYRKGFDFSKDSREYVNPTHIDSNQSLRYHYRCTYLPIVNETLEQFRSDIRRTVTYFLLGEA